MLYFAALIMAIGLFGMYLAKGMGKMATLAVFGVFGFVMICGYILTSALCGSIMRDYTPKDDVGKLQGVRMVFAVLIPMIVGPMIGNAINKARNIPLANMNSSDTMTTMYIPAPEIFLVAAIASLLMIAIIPILKREIKNGSEN
jgi:MFS family permease